MISFSLLSGCNQEKPLLEKAQEEEDVEFLRQEFLTRVGEMPAILFTSYSSRAELAVTITEPFYIWWGDGNFDFYQGGQYGQLVHNYTNNYANGNQVMVVARPETVETMVTGTDEVANLNVSACINLKGLGFTISSTSVNLSNNTELVLLMCAGGNLSTLNLSNNNKLGTLMLGATKVTSLDLSNKPELTYVLCSNNKISRLTLGNNSKLTTLLTQGNLLTDLDLRGAPALTTLECSNNQLRSLNLSQCTELKYLGCYENRLTSLNLSPNIALETLYCYNNSLQTLNISSNLALKALECYNNNLTTLDVANKPELKTVEIQYNNFDLGALFSIAGALSDRTGKAQGRFRYSPHNAMVQAMVSAKNYSVSGYN